MDTRCVQELNQLLKGTHMGASLFEDLKGESERSGADPPHR